jgi:hypothetical protein
MPYTTTYYSAGATSRPVSNFDREFNRTRDAISTGAKVAMGIGITFGVSNLDSPRSILPKDHPRLRSAGM